MIDYSELAETQFYELKEETLDDDRKSLGAENDKNYDIEGEKFNISVSGFWEKSTWFDYVVKGENGNIIEEGIGD